jgi:hypothetical protein
VDTLAVQLTIPPAGVVGDFHPQVIAPCRAHTKKVKRVSLRFTFGGIYSGYP